MKTIFVSGALANKPWSGGEAWVRLNWVLGLQKLGFEVVFVEQLALATSVDAAGVASSFERSVNRAYFDQVTEAFGLSHCACLIFEGGRQTGGMALSQVLERAAEAELLINISGHLTWEPLLRRLRRKAYIDIDPGFTQFWHNDASLDFRVAGHDFYFTIGENIGTPECLIPLGGIEWHHTRPPIVLPQWPVAALPGANRFTTVANWRGPFGAIQFEGRSFGLKLHEFRKLIELPLRAPGAFEIALNIHPDEKTDLQRLHDNRWQLVDPLAAARDPLVFRDYVRGSGAEFSVAQGVYVDTQSGWFSDRTVGYLASGRPALVQDTGWSRNYPAGEGLVPFRTLDEAIVGAEQIMNNYARHSRAARAVAEAHFDSDKVLGRLLEEVGVGP